MVEVKPRTRHEAEFPEGARWGDLRRLLQQYDGTPDDSKITVTTKGFSSQIKTITIHVDDGARDDDGQPQQWAR